MRSHTWRYFAHPLSRSDLDSEVIPLKQGVYLWQGPTLG